MMKILSTVAVACILPSIALSDGMTVKYAITNLNDQLRTEVTYPVLPSFSLKRLDKLSQITDRHKKQHIKTRLDNNVTDLNLDVYSVQTVDPRVPEVKMARIYSTLDKQKPLYVMSDKIVLDSLATRDIYVNRLAGGVGLDTLSIKDITSGLLKSASPYALQTAIVNTFKTQGLSIDSYALKNLSLDSAIVKQYGTLKIDLKTLDAQTLGLTSATLASLNLKDVTLADIAVQSLISKSSLISKPSVISLDIDPVFGDKMYLDSMSLTSLDVTDMMTQFMDIDAILYSKPSADVALYSKPLKDLSLMEQSLVRSWLSRCLSVNKMSLPYLLVMSGITPSTVMDMSVKDLYKHASVYKPSMTDMTLTPQQMTDMSVIYKTLYADYSVEHIVIDNSRFSVVISPDDLKSLEDMTEIYKFTKKFDTCEYCLRDLTKIDMPEYQVWMHALLSNQTCNISFVKNKKIYKVIGEAKLEHNINEFTAWQKSTLEKNLAVMKAYGYDTVLVRFYADNNMDEVVKMVQCIRDNGFRVYSTYVGLDGPYREKNGERSWNPFHNTPSEIEDSIARVAPLSDGWLLNWRGTSFHAKILPAEFYNFICNTVRKYNPTCLVYGEIYYGHIGPTRSLQSMVYNAPKNVTGVIINNMGYSGYNHAYIATRLFSKAVPNYSKMDKIAQVIGYAPYYRSRNDMFFSVDEEYKHKQKIEKSFAAARCGTVTMLHDGVDDGYVDFGHYWTCDSLLTDRSFMQKYEKLSGK